MNMFGGRLFSGKSSYTPKPPPQQVETTYEPYPVKVPPDLLAPLDDPSSVQVQWVDFASAIPEYTDFTAAIIDNIVSEKECRQLIHLAETAAGLHQNDSLGGDATEAALPDAAASSESGPGQVRPGRRGWQPALVAAGFNSELPMTDYRNSDRIIWDHQELTTRLWRRMLQVAKLKDRLSELRGSQYEIAGGNADGYYARATDYGINERMRFLKYGPGQFFKPHADSMFKTPDGKRSYFTVHLYLNNSAESLRPGDVTPDTLRGGSTPFLSGNRKRRIDVWPKAGRILLFQQRRLVHSGDEVKRGVKYTMRSEIMYDVLPMKAEEQEPQAEGDSEEAGAERRT
ncbi:hypothetical protein KEM52_001103 [Ascosphaera acerosa]|nr:hypothetical protein KEM52_001103 [Ascosphaera acerosa]